MFQKELRFPISFKNGLKIILILLIFDFPAGDCVINIMYLLREGKLKFNGYLVLIFIKCFVLKFYIICINGFSGNYQMSVNGSFDSL